VIFAACIIKRDWATGLIEEPVHFYMGHDLPEQIKDFIVDLAQRRRDECQNGKEQATFLPRISIQAAFLEE
jgi:hypothetical protein